MFDQALSERFWSKVNKTDSCWLWTAAKDKNGYGRFSEHGTLTGAHQFSYRVYYGALTPGKVLDHLCHNKACVNPAHLEEVTQKVNVERQGARTNNVSGLRGVYWSDTRQKWIAQVGHKGKRYNLGGYDTAEEAGRVAEAKRQDLYSQ